jgi:hypothetical protein
MRRIVVRGFRGYLQQCWMRGGVDRVRDSFSYLLITHFIFQSVQVDGESMISHAAKFRALLAEPARLRLE